jgi:hypothetical protein
VMLILGEKGNTKVVPRHATHIVVRPVPIETSISVY